MNANFFNLVSSRSLSGDHAALQRWYADHIGILWRCEALQSAMLLQKVSARDNPADYLCFYAFPDEAGFQSFETGPARAAAAQVIQDGWGREGIAITERRQYQRLWQRRSATGSLIPGRVVVASYGLEVGDWDEVSRWLVDQTHVLFAEHGVRGAKLYQGTSEGEILLILETGGSLPDWRSWLDTSRPAWGEAPKSIQPRWFWEGRTVAHWTR